MDEFEAIEDSFAVYAQQLVEDPVARFKAMRACAFFGPLSDDELRRIAGMVDIQIFFSDVCLTTQDDEAQVFYVILHGAAEVYRNGKRVGDIGSGECIGEGIFFADAGHATSATVIADYKIIAATFSRELVGNLQSDAAIMVSLNKALLLSLYRKLKGANQKIEDLMLRQSMHG